MLKPVFISDLGGIIYSFSKDFDSAKHDAEFQEAIKWYLENQSENKDKLDIEELAVTKALKTGEKKAPGLLPFYINETATKKLLEHWENYKVIIVATSRIKTSRLILEKAIGECQPELPAEQSFTKIIAFYYQNVQLATMNHKQGTTNFNTPTGCHA